MLGFNLSLVRKCWECLAVLIVHCILISWQLVVCVDSKEFVTTTTSRS